MKFKKKRQKQNTPQTKSISSGLQKGERALAAGQFAEAVNYFSAVSKDSPDYGRACKGHGSALLRLHRLKEALPFLQTAHLALPKDAEILVDGADVARLMGSLGVAEDTYKSARELGAKGFQIEFGEASIYQERKQWLEAIHLWTALDKAYQKNPFVLHNFGKAWHELGETDKAITLMSEAFELGGETATLSTLALLSPHAGNCNHQEIKRYRVNLGNQLKLEEGNPPDVLENKKNKPIKIGYVSAFFHRRNWMKPVWALLNNHNRKDFNIHLFADSPPEEINTEGGYISHEDDKIFDVRKLNNRELAKLISDCEIDVLVDLNSYSTIRRLGLWTAKPAPVTIGWFNLYATSGMSGIEWLIGDNVVIHSHEEEFYTEKILRLNQSYLTFQVGYDTPDIEIPDANEPFTFGCLGSGYKITPEVRAAWIKILRETEKTRLVVRNRVFNEESHKKWFLDFFIQAEIEADRIILLGPADHKEFIQTYGKIDLALDTFPYNGGTTTMESLWQGVPVVCFKGDRWISRTSATLLHSAGLDEFIGENENEYIEIAKKWSLNKQKPQLRKLRGEMRKHLEKSKVCDGAGLARDFERIVFEILH